MEPATVTFVDLAPLLGVMVGSMLTFFVAIVGFMRSDSSKNRDLIEKNRDLIEKNHQEVTASLGEVRERLSHIEGFLTPRTPPPPDYDGGVEAEAA